MILILSRSRNELTTEEVIDWLEAKGAEFFRLNAEDLEYPGRFSFQLNNEKLKPELKFFDSFSGEEKRLAFDEVKSVWYRRWTLMRQYNLSHVEEYTDDDWMQFEITRHLNREVEALGSIIFDHLKEVHWLSNPITTKLKKIDVLQKAQEAGLDIPDTIISTEKEEVRAFKQKHGRVVTKNIGLAPFGLSSKEGSIASFTSELEEETLEKAEDVFFPSLLQEFLDKRYEIRIFYLENEFFPMAIFSQSDEKTKMDFRHYLQDKPNRYVPYRISDSLKERLNALMKSLHLTTGSIDMVKTVDGREVFLEINPVGQFGMVSGPCNYYLEEKVAEHLMNNDA